MEKLSLVGALALFGAMNAQKSSEATSKGKWVIETNAGSPLHYLGLALLLQMEKQFGMQLGAEGGYFVADNLAVKAGLGFGDFGGDNLTTYRLGVQYYLDGKFPLAADFTGASTGGESINYFGVEGGYAWFVAPNVALTPKLRYNITLDDQKAPSSFQGLIGFSLFSKGIGIN